jgi:cation:H+ antiporter
LLIITLVFVALFFLPDNIGKTLGIALIVFYIIFFVTEIIWGKEGSSNEDKKTLAKLERSKGNPILYFLGVALSIGGLIISSKYLVASVIEISKAFNINQELIGLSLVALGTSLPELAAAISSGIKKDWKLLYGDIQGSNIFNLSIIGAILIIFGGNGYSIDVFSLVFMAVTIFSVILLSHKYMGTNIPRGYGIIYILVYVFYIYKIYKF